jgi:hypothetical protein
MTEKNASSDDSTMRTYPELARMLIVLRMPLGKDSGVTAEERDHEIVSAVMDFLHERGEFMRCPLPIYFDRRQRKIYRMEKNAHDLAFMLHSMHLLEGQRHFYMVQNYVMTEAARSPIRQRHGFAYCTADSKTAYFRADQGMMYRVTADTIDTVPLGHRGVLLMDEDIGDFPSLEEITPLIDELRPKIGNRTILPIKNSPMALLTTRWSKASHFTPGQAQTMFLARLMFFGFGPAIKLWPLALLTGEQGSGKSTPCEMWLSFMAGQDRDAPALPGAMRDFIAAATNQSCLVFDNCDGARLDDPDKSEYSDHICAIATGGQISLAVLFQTNVLAKFSIRNHAFFTAREYPFNRSDIARRLLHFEVEPMIDCQPVSKAKIIEQVLGERNRIMAEYLIRTQNIIRAIAATEGREYPVGSEMPDYQTWTLQCADYEGALPAMERLWVAFSERYRISITENNPIIYAVQMWLGSHFVKHEHNPKNQLATTLFYEIKQVMQLKQIPFSYQSPTKFGIHLGNSMEGLRLVGLSRTKSKGKGKLFSFDVSEEQRKACIALYREVGLSMANQAPNKPEYAEDDGIDFGDQAGSTRVQ